MSFNVGKDSLYKWKSKYQWKAKLIKTKKKLTALAATKAQKRILSALAANKGKNPRLILKQRKRKGGIIAHADDPKKVRYKHTCTWHGEQSSFEPAEEHGGGGQQVPQVTRQHPFYSSAAAIETKINLH